VVHPDLLSSWLDGIVAARSKIDNARSAIVEAVDALRRETDDLRTRWGHELEQHKMAVAAALAEAGVESPQELIDRVASLRKLVDDCEEVKQPRLKVVEQDICAEESERARLLTELEKTDEEITVSRLRKAKEMTEGLDGQIRISIEQGAERTDYKETLNSLVSSVTTGGRRIQNRDSQLDAVVGKLGPLRLAQSLIRGGQLDLPGGRSCTLSQYCGITENTQEVLCFIGKDIELLDRLQTVSAADVPKILVRRKGESTYAELRGALSQGEQSAAILTLALQSRSMTLILDQPEDELGYAYVVHLVVPRILRAKFSRQLLVVSHNANIPVLGDADFVIKMENRPRAEGGRSCVVAQAGCFEDAGITRALVELEGGTQAFQFRRHRYALPRQAGRP
jgi:hypothetical protein